jgi:NADH:ubiquinone oxidoreductase subunit E
MDYGDKITTVEDIIEKYHNKPDSLISILQDIQAVYRYLPEESLRKVSNIMGLPIIQVYGVATFFKTFSLKPKGRHLISVCLGTACHVRNAPTVLDEIERQLGIKSGNSTDDMQFTLETVNCLGACALGPIVVIDGKYYGQMRPGKVKEILSKYKKTTGHKKNEKAKIQS